MGIFLSLSLFVVALLWYLSEKDVCSPSFIFSLFWGIIIFFSSLNLFNIYSVSNYAYVLLTIGVIFFSIGAIFVKKVSTKKNVVLFKVDDNIIDEKKYIILFAICLLLLLPDLRMLLYFFRNGFNVSNIYYTIAQNSAGSKTAISGITFGSNFQNIFKVYVGYPLLYLLMSAGLLLFLKNKKRKFLIISIILLLIRFFVDMKRTIIIMYFFMFVFFTLLLNKGQEVSAISKKVPKSRKKTLFIGSVIIIFVYLYISVTRRNSTEGAFSLIRNFYFYYCGSVKYFDLRIQNLITDTFVHTFGLFSLRGMLSPIISFFDLIGLVSEPFLFTEASNYLTSLHNTVYWISPIDRFNSYTTCFFEFYVDGGLIGILVGSFIFGAVSQKLYAQYCKGKSLRQTLRLGYFISIFILFSMLQISSIINYLIWPLIIDKIIFKKKKSM